MQFPSGHIFIFDQPLYVYLGMLTFVFLIITAILGMLVLKGKYHIPFSWHMNMARITVLTAILHGIFFVWATFF